MNKKNNSLYKNTIFKVVLNIFNLIIPILIGPYVMRVLSPRQIGNLNFVQSIFGYFFIFAGFGVVNYGIREISRIKDDKKKLSQTFTSLFLIALLTNIIAIVGYLLFVFNKNIDQEVLTVAKLFTIYFIFNIFQVEWIVTALEEFKFITIKTIIVKILYVVSIIVFVKSPDDFSKYVFIIISTSCLGNLISYFYIKKNFKFDFSNVQILKHIKPMLLMVVISNANVLYTQLDRYMLGSFVGVTILSYYAIAQGLIGVINTLLLSVIQACIPRLNSYVGKNNKNLYINLLYKISRIYFMLLFPACIGMILLSENLIVLYGGSQYIGTGVVLASFSIYMITLGFDNILGNQIMYINRCEKVQVKFLFLGGLINFIFNILLVKIKMFNPSTAIVTTALCNVVVIFLQHIYIKNKLKLQYNIFSFKNMKYLFISLIFIPIGMVIKFLNINFIIETLVIIILCTIVYFLILVFIKDEIFKSFVDKIFLRFKTKINQ